MCENDGCAWCGGAARRAGHGVPTCRAVRGVRSAVGAVVNEPHRSPRPAPPARPPQSARTFAPLPPRHAALRSARPPRRFTEQDTRTRHAHTDLDRLYTRAPTRRGTNTPLQTYTSALTTARACTI
ncbi:unnamed protein product [Euphydryas editha]|uniref:Uncharacterized protein n=1 Tax=Euphydryas editha TaxID=104508 RepID=A0AAU9TK10_EUPED|nr:unnamed protein product [Euphydryas editha]